MLKFKLSSRNHNLLGIIRVYITKNSKLEATSQTVGQNFRKLPVIMNHTKVNCSIYSYFVGHCNFMKCYENIIIAILVL